MAPRRHESRKGGNRTAPETNLDKRSGITHPRVEYLAGRPELAEIYTSGKGSVVF